MTILKTLSAHRAALLAAFGAACLPASSMAVAQGEDIVARSTIGLSLARQMLAAAESEAARHDAKVSIVIVDDRGALILAQRMDGASHLSVDVAAAKARTSANLKAPTADLGNLYKSGATELASIAQHLPYGSGLTLIGGGVPVSYKSAVIGGIGVSGAPPETDAKIALAGAAVAATKP